MQRAVATFTKFALVFVLIAGLQMIVSAQGRGGGHGGGGGAGAGNRGGGQPSDVGVDRGISTSSERSDGRADAGRGTASDRSGGRFDEGQERARMQHENAQHADDELRSHPQMAEKLHTNANDLRSGYQAALATNPNLRFGQYVAATRLGANLGSRHPNITTDAILAGLASGKSIGKTLQGLGLGKEEANDAQKRAEREIKDSKRN